MVPEGTQHPPVAYTVATHSPDALGFLAGGVAKVFLALQGFLILPF